MYRCLVCQNEFEPFMTFGKMPIANGFLLPDQFGQEYFFELKVGYCSRCGMVQLADLVDREKMFHENYAFFSSTSRRMLEHFREFAELIQNNYLRAPDPFVVEIGSNDGIMLQHFANKKIRHLGIEPSANVARVATEKGINTVQEFFDATLAKKIVSEYGQADVFAAANVMCHIPYMHSILEGIKLLLKPKGVVLFEDPYLGDIVQKTSYDQIYDEHAFYFSLHSVNYIFREHGMEVIDIMPQNVHGGSMRYVISHKGSHPVNEAVRRQLAKEEQLGLRRPETYTHLRKNIERSREELMKTLTNLRRSGKRIVGYGATSKSTTVTNYCGITPDLVEFISDTTPIKHGKYSPGTHIPVKPYEEFCRNYPDIALLFAWNHGEEIIEKEKKFVGSGGKFLLYVPNVHIV